MSDDFRLFLCSGLSRSASAGVSLWLFGRRVACLPGPLAWWPAPPAGLFCRLLSGLGLLACWLPFGLLGLPARLLGWCLWSVSRRLVWRFSVVG